MKRLYGNRHFGGALFAASILILLIIAIVIGLNRPQAATDKEDVTPPVVTPSSEVVTAPPLPSSGASAVAVDQPSPEEVWGFEAANLLLVPAQRNAALLKYATARYISEHQINDPLYPDDVVTPHIDQDKSIMNAYVSADKLSCTIVAYAAVQTMRGDTIVSTYSAPSHTTVWIKTTSGWRADQQQTIELR